MAKYINTFNLFGDIIASMIRENKSQNILIGFGNYDDMQNTKRKILEAFPNIKHGYTITSNHDTGHIVIRLTKNNIVTILHIMHINQHRLRGFTFDKIYISTHGIEWLNLLEISAYAREKYITLFGDE